MDKVTITEYEKLDKVMFLYIRLKKEIVQCTKEQLYNRLNMLCQSVDSIIEDRTNSETVRCFALLLANDIREHMLKV